MVIGVLLALLCNFGNCTLESYKISKNAFERYGEAYGDYDWYCNRVGYRMALKEFKKQKYDNKRIIQRET